MDLDELLARIQRDARLYGRNETRRAVCAVLTALGELLPAPAYRRLVAAVPAELRVGLPRPGAGRIAPVGGCRAFVGRVADRLHLDGPDAAFLARVVLGHLNARPRGRGWAPAELSPLVPADLRPLLRAGVVETPAVSPAPRRVATGACRRLPGGSVRVRRPGRTAL